VSLQELSTPHQFKQKVGGNSYRKTLWLGGIEKKTLGQGEKVPIYRHTNSPEGESVIENMGKTGGGIGKRGTVDDKEKGKNEAKSTNRFHHMCNGVASKTNVNPMIPSGATQSKMGQRLPHHGRGGKNLTENEKK